MNACTFFKFWSCLYLLPIKFKIIKRRGFVRAQEQETVKFHLIMSWKLSHNILHTQFLNELLIGSTYANNPKHFSAAVCHRPSQVKG